MKPVEWRQGDQKYSKDEENEATSKNTSNCVCNPSWYFWQASKVVKLRRFLFLVNLVFFGGSVYGVLRYAENNARKDVTWTVVMSAQIMEEGQTCDSVGSRFCKSWGDSEFAIDAKVQLNRHVSWAWILVVVMGIQVVASLGYWQLLPEDVKNPTSWRWFEYTLTSPLQIVFIAFTLLNCDVYLLILLGFLQFSLMFFGDVIEWMLYDNEKSDSHWSRIYWYFGCAWIIHAVIWGILFSHLSSLISQFDNVPGIVWAIVFTEFFCFTSFGVLLLTAIIEKARNGTVNWQQNDVSHSLLTFIVMALTLQQALFVEGILRRLLYTLVPVVLSVKSERSEVQRFGDSSVVGVAFAVLTDLALAPLRFGGSFLVVTSRRGAMIFAVALVVVVLVVLNHYWEHSVSSSVRVYNVLVSPAVWAVLGLVQVFSEALRILVVVWNLVFFVLKMVVTRAFFPFVSVNQADFVDLAESLAVMVSALVASLSTWVENIAGCTGKLGGCPAGATCIFQEIDVRCAASVNHVTLDLMTPGILARRAFGSLFRVFSKDCGTAGLAAKIALLPLVDLRLYRALHVFAGTPFFVVGWVVQTAARCRHLKREGFSKLEVTVGCTPDLLVVQNWFAGGVEDAGRVVDNWLNAAMLVSQESLEGVTVCAAGGGALGVPGLVQDAATALEEPEQRLRVVGVTESTFAVVQARTVGFRTAAGGDVWSVGVWPFEVDVLLGLAPVLYAGRGGDMDDDERDQPTGLLGCRCVDETGGIRVLCASVPFLGSAADSQSSYNASTIHRTWLHTEAGRGVEVIPRMRCASTLIKVTPLRFARGRMLEKGRSALDELAGFGASSVARLRADAAVFVQPWCGGEDGDERCGPGLPCFPWCMGLHVGGMANHNMSLFPTHRWEETVSVRQADCGVATHVPGVACAGKGSAVEVELPSGRVQQALCASSQCEASEHGVSALNTSVLSRSLQNLKRARQAVRLDSQPFAVAGDAMLSVETDGGGERAVVVSRLLSSTAEGPERLTLVSNARALPVARCSRLDEACVAAAAANGSVVLPASVRQYAPRELPATQSKWAIHWAENPPIEVYEGFFAWCRNVSTLQVVVDSAYGVPRVWTVQTARSVDLTGEGTEDASPVAYMRVPGFFEPEVHSCADMVGLKVVGVEYVNADNVLVSVLHGRPQDFHAAEMDLCAGCVRSYRYYWLNPSEHRCLGAGGDEQKTFSCWRSESEGMWQAQHLDGISGSTEMLCPAAQRLPRVGSIVAEGVLVSWHLAHSIAQTVLGVGAAQVAQDVAGLFDVRLERLTFHSQLDTGGSQILAIDQIETSLERFALHTSNALVHIVQLGRGLPLAATAERIATGTAHVLTYMPQEATFDPTHVLRGLRNIPFMQTAGNAADAVSGAGSSSSMYGRFMGAMQRLYQRALDTTALMMRVLRGGIVKTTRAAARRLRDQVGEKLSKFPEQASASLKKRINLGNTIYAVDAIKVAFVELSDEIRFDLLDKGRWSCHGFAMIVGPETALGIMTKEACMLGIDLLNGVVEVVVVMVSEYPVVSCACTVDAESASTVDIQLESVQAKCLPHFQTSEQYAWVQRLIWRSDNIERPSVCYAAMDAANRRLQTAFDAALGRMAAIADAAGDLVQELASLGLLDPSSCDDFESSWVMSILPYPSDYFMQCMETADCRVRCRDAYLAFDDALMLADSSAIVETIVDVEMESALFHADDVEEGRADAPFHVMSVLQLPASVCFPVCGAAPCASVAGSAVAEERLLMAYYCLPRDISFFVQRVSFNSSLPVMNEGEKILQVHVATGFRQSGGDWVVVVAQEGFRTKVFLAMPGGQRQSIVVAASDSSEWVSDDMPWQAFNSLKSVRVVPALNEDQAVVVVVNGFRLRNTPGMAPGGAAAVVAEPLCVQLAFTSDDVRFGTLALLWSEQEGSRWQRCGPTSLLLSEEHRHVCRYEECFEEFLLPRTLTATLQVARFPGRERTGLLSGASSVENVGLAKRSLAQVLGADTKDRISKTQSGWERKQAVVSAVSYSTDDSAVEIVTCNAAGYTAWLHILRLDVPAASASVKDSWKTTSQATVRRGCTIEDCGACGVSLDLQAKCFLAQECGVEQCMGTEVNLMKPLCNMGQLLSDPLNLQRIAVAAVWAAMSENIIKTVEISARRREKYSITWPGDAVTMGLCAYKDASVHLAAFLASIGNIGRVVAAGVVILQGQKIDERADARWAIGMASVTNFFTSVLLLPVYVASSLQEMFFCNIDNTAIMLSRLGGETRIEVRVDVPRRLFPVLDGADAQDMCMNSPERVSAGQVDSSQVAHFARTVADITMGIAAGFTTTSKRMVVSVIESLLSWLVGVTYSTADIAQVVDWKNCKAPGAAGGDSHTCVCGDKAYAIPAQAKAHTAREQAFWCAGPLLVMSADNSKLRLVWNPFSLAELLSNGMEEYVMCVQQNGDCESLRPQNFMLLENQGVQALQVITRCRANYAQRRWDPGSVVFGLFPREQWASGVLEFDDSDGEHQGLKRQMERIAQRQPVTTMLSPRVWACLERAASTRHDCHEEAGERFAYEIAHSQAFFRDVDGCGALTGVRPDESAGLSPFVWQSESGNKAPVAKRHEVASGEDALVGFASRLARIRGDIAKVFKSLGTEDTLRRSIEEGLRARVFSVEGDELHQFVDCVMMGPFAAADVFGSVTMRDGRRMASPQYHRGDPSSREFGRGSALRRQVIDQVLDGMHTDAEASIVDNAVRVVRELEQVLLVNEALLCECAGAEPSLACCKNNVDENLWSRPEDVVFRHESMLDETHDISQAVYMDLLRVASETVLQRIWHNFTLSPEPISESDREELWRLQLFHEGALDFSVDETTEAWGNETLWDFCSRIAGSRFFTLPLRSRASLERLGLDPDVLEVDADLSFDATAGDPAQFVHAMEGLVQRVLTQARAQSPLFWSRVHRYRPSESVWCEADKPAAPAEGPVFVGDLLHRCVCEWHDGMNCTIPASVCAEHATLQDLCAGYSAPTDVFRVLDALSSDPSDAWQQHCQWTEPQAWWGLLDPHDAKRFLEQPSGAFDIDQQELLSHGVGGLRSGVQPPRNLLATFRRFLNVRLNHSIAQPTCSAPGPTDDLREYFRDVFVPMAHDVVASPVEAACSRWVIEHALATALEQLDVTDDSVDRQQQITTERLWRSRCVAQLERVSICELRGLMDPANAPEWARAVKPASCAWRAADLDVSCGAWFVTPSCLLRCRDKWFDPCLCDTGRNCDEVVISDPINNCAAGLLGDTSRWVVADYALLTSSLYREGGGGGNIRPDMEALYWSIADVLLEKPTAADGEYPPEMCDGLLDYWPSDAQHPVGYHPTTACAREETNMRGFPAWMSGFAGGEEAYSADPVRLRNLTRASEFFGEGHSVCDVSAYASSREPLNVLQLEARWNGILGGDPAVPGDARLVDEQLMTVLGRGSGDAFDVPMDHADAFLRHSVGLVRAWARWIDEDASAEDRLQMQNELDAFWPHWEGPAYYRSEVACAMPPLTRCASDSECDSELRCLKNADDESQGICMEAGTCYRHTHCGDGLMCSGVGRCEKPRVRFQNKGNEEITVKLFGESCSENPNYISQFDAIPDFAHAHGMCSSRNWQDYKSVVNASRLKDGLYEANDAPLSLLSGDYGSSVLERGVLKPVPHVCDRSYEQTAYRMCVLPGTRFATGEGRVQADYQTATRTWREANGTLSVRFCDLRTSLDNVVGFLSPMRDSVLSGIEDKLARCSQFQVCPETRFAVEGKKVRRRVRVVINGFFTASFRDYCYEDENTCGGIGYKQGSCESNQKCVVDLFVVPLLTKIVEYDPTDKAIIANMYNREVLEYFNRTSKPLSSLSEDTYIDHVAKAKRLAKDLMDRRNYFAENNPYVIDEVVPGSSLYLFKGRVAVHVSFKWLWQCALVGVGQLSEDWLDKLDQTKQCKNFAPGMQSDELTVSTLLQQTDALFSVQETGFGTFYANQVLHDIDELIVFALDFLGISFLPDAWCVSGVSDENFISGSIGPEQRSIRRFGLMAGRDEQRETIEPSSVSFFNVFSGVRKKLLGDNSFFDNRQWSTLTFRQLLEKNVITIRDFEEDRVSRMTEFVPGARFEALTKNKMEIYASEVYESLQNFTRVTLQDYIDAEKDGCDTGQSALVNPEFKLTEPLSCTGFQSNANLLPCSDTIVEMLQQRTFLRYEEVLYLVLRIIEREIYLRPGIAQSLNLYRDRGSESSFLFNNPSAVESPLFVDALKYNVFMDNLLFKCRETTFEQGQETSVAHRELRHCVEQLQTNVGWRLPAAETLEVVVSPRLLLQGMYPTFHTAHDNSFTRQLFATDIAKEVHAPFEEAICFLRGDVVGLINPFWAGDFDIEKGCDTAVDAESGVRYFDTLCYTGEDDTSRMQACNNRFPSYIETLPKPCINLDKQTLVRLNMGSLKTSETPLCRRRPAPDSRCNLRFGALGGFRGTRASSLDGEQEVVQVLEGLWNSKNTVVRGGRVDSLLALRVLESDIAGHSIEFALDRDGVLSVACIGLGPVAPTQGCRLRSAFWMQSLENDFAQQHNVLTQVMGTDSGKWHCPVTWLSMYAGDDKHIFAARSPDARRNAARFAHITGRASGAHPAVAAVHRVRNLRPGWFVSETQVCTAETSRDPGCRGADLLASAKAFLQGQWTLVEFKGGGVCDQILDWPHTATMLRDGTSHSPPEDAPCNVYARLPRFRLRATQRTRLAPTWRMVAPCRMGRLPRIGPAALRSPYDSVQQCRQLLNDGEVTQVECRVLSQNATAVGADTYRVVFDASAPFAPRREHVRAARRRTCARCDEHSAGFVHRNLSTSSLQAERALLSVGLPIALSTERVLAAELRRKVMRARCGEAVGSCDAGLREMANATWARGAFLQRLLWRSVFKTDETRPPTGGANPERAVWGAEWAFCDAKGSCSGRVDRTAWLNYSTRPGACAAAVGNASRASAPVNFCLLTPAMEDLCRKLVQWRVDTKQLLCQASGLCPLHEYVYSPTSFDVVNKEFVRQTVAEFYKDSGVTCPADASGATGPPAWDSRRCSANSVLAIAQKLADVRSIAMLLVELVFDFNDIFVTFVTAVADASSGAAAALRELPRKIGKLFMKIKDAFNAVVNALFSMLRASENSLLKAIMDIFDAVCPLIQIVMNLIIKPLSCSEYSPSLFSIIGDVFMGLADVLDEISSFISDLIVWVDDDFAAGIISLVNGTGVALKSINLCDEIQICGYGRGADETETATEPGPLSFPTRCWAAYSTFFGDTHQLSCSAADTCQDGLTGLKVCGDCGPPDAGRGKYGCHPSTKLCSCNVPELEASLCVSNADCQQPGTGCRYIDSEVELMRGAVACGACQGGSVCFAVGGSSGVCGCGLFPLAFSQCSADNVNDVMKPQADDLCVYARDASQQQLGGVLVWGELLSAPCLQLSPTSVYCSYFKDLQTWLNVGFYLSPTTFRRLLAVQDADVVVDAPPPNATLDPLCRDALSAPSGALEHTRAACIDVFHWSASTVRVLKAELPACAFCSVRDTLDAMHTHPAQFFKAVFNPSGFFVVVQRHTVLRDMGVLARQALQTVRVVVQAGQHLARAHKKHTADTFWNASFQHDLEYLVHARAQVQTAGVLYENVTLHINIAAEHVPHARRLAGLESVAASVEAIARSATALHARFSESVATGFGFSYPSLYLVNSPLLGQWPPQTTGAENNCSFLSIVLDVMLDGGRHSLVALNERPSLPPVALADSWPTLGDGSLTDEADFRNVSNVNDDVNEYAQKAFEYVEMFDYTSRHVIRLLEVMAQAVADSFSCDYEAMQTCSSWRVRLVNGLYIVTSWWLASFVLFGFMGIGWVPALLLPLALPVLLYLCYGWTIMCFPGIPPCLVGDFLTTVDLLLPRLLSVPAPLLEQQDSRGKSCLSYRPRVECVKRCSTPVLGYNSWQAVVSWWVVESGLETWVAAVNDKNSWIDMASMRGHLEYRREIIASDDSDMKSAHRLCAVVTLFIPLPYLALAAILAIGTLNFFLLLLQQTNFGWFLLSSAWFVSVSSRQKNGEEEKDEIDAQTDKMPLISTKQNIQDAA